MVDIQPNTNIYKGTVAIFNYEKSGLKHVAVVEYVFEDGSFLTSECNYHAGECGFRHLQPTYPNLLGFYTPNFSLNVLAK